MKEWTCSSRAKGGPCVQQKMLRATKSFSRPEHQSEPPQEVVDYVNLGGAHSRDMAKPHYTSEYMGLVSTLPQQNCADCLSFSLPSTEGEATVPSTACFLGESPGPRVWGLGFQLWLQTTYCMTWIKLPALGLCSAPNQVAEVELFQRNSGRNPELSAMPLAKSPHRRKKFQPATARPFRPK